MGRTGFGGGSGWGDRDRQRYREAGARNTRRMRVGGVRAEAGHGLSARSSTQIWRKSGTKVSVGPNAHITRRTGPDLSRGQR